MRHGWIGVLALVVVPAGGALAATNYNVTQLPGPVGSTLDSAAGLSPFGVVGYSYIGDFSQQSGIYQPTLWQGSQSALLPVPDGSQGWASGINNQGTVVGTVRGGGSSQPQPALWQNGQLQILPMQGMSGGSANSINSQGDVAGTISDSLTGQSQAVLWRNGRVITLGSFPGAQSTGFAVNDADQVVVGASYGNRSETWLWSNGTLSQIPSLGGDGITGNSINAQGDIVGVASDENGLSTGFLYSQGSTVALGSLPDSILAQALSLNNADQIVGYSEDSENGFHALLWQNGNVLDLNDLIAPNSGWTLLDATSIGNDGTIVGYGGFDGQISAFELTPTASPSGTASVPEPATVGVLGVGGLLLLRRRRRSV